MSCTFFVTLNDKFVKNVYNLWTFLVASGIIRKIICENVPFFQEAMI